MNIKSEHQKIRTLAVFNDLAILFSDEFMEVQRPEWGTRFKNK